ncbi:MAG: hypothetical protein AVDCRST_MAG50-796 [uncultured Acidimicrobiales bacterium]|uniref:Transglutaminase-like domain-containing protein n=1 Tax=uncultured Acidimicrobiales bacterium TaxID=310071 RepID=A0A6J4HJU2_9ACTN|nr:MAG: hypothetical protein AVDCRST_MAG50-796 [uncultured Acidimicrobiales bacterium]
MLRKANAPRPPEDSVALRVVVAIAVIAATTATLAQGVGGSGLRVAATVGIAFGFAFSHWARHRDGYLLKVGLALGVVIAFASFLDAVLGASTGSLAEIQIPLAELFLWVQLLHALDVPARRDLLFSLLSSLVLMAVAGVLSISGGLAVYLVVWGVATASSLVLAYRSEIGDLPPLVDVHGRLAEQRSTVTRPLIGAVALVLLVATAVFLVVPAAGAGRAVAFPAQLPSRVPVPDQGGLANPSLGADDPSGPGAGPGQQRASFGYFGFSQTMDTSLRGRPDDTLVMRVKAARPDFWRGQTFDLWDGRVWEQSDHEPATRRGSSPIELRGSVEDRAILDRSASVELVQTVYVERPGPNLIFAAASPQSLYMSDNAVFELNDGTVRTGVELSRGAVYSVVSRRPAVTESILRAAGEGRVARPGTVDRNVADRYTQLPEVPERVARLARDVTASSLTTYDKVRALEAWMGANTTYTLDIPPLPAGADAVEQYLFVDKQGFCEQIGTALVVMLRSLGVPARLAVGYTPGERNPFTGLFEVRADDAHAWAEVYFPGVGWQAFDPTAAVPLAGEPFSSSAGTGLVSFLAGRLPSLPAQAPEVLAGLGAALAITLAGAGAVRRRVAKRRALAARTWPDLFLERLEVAGAERGRPRRASESAIRYSEALSTSVLPDRRVADLGHIIETAAFGPEGVEDRERRLAESVLHEAASASPTAGREP